MLFVCDTATATTPFSIKLLLLIFRRIVSTSCSCGRRRTASSDRDGHCADLLLQRWRKMPMVNVGNHWHNLCHQTVGGEGPSLQAEHLSRRRDRLAGCNLRGSSHATGGSIFSKVAADGGGCWCRTPEHTGQRQRIERLKWLKVGFRN
jgi:hypothetical protein